jgi:hypothetical protein
LKRPCDAKMIDDLTGLTPAFDDDGDKDEHEGYPA